MADREPGLEDIRNFMDEDERLDWDSGKGSPEERVQFWKSLEVLWRSIPDPTEDQLHQLMRSEDWQHYQEDGNRYGIFGFYIRKWKKDRKAAAREAQRSKPESDAGWESDKPLEAALQEQLERDKAETDRPPTKGIRVPGQTRSPTEQEQAAAELLKFMPNQLRAEYEKVDNEQKKVLWEANKGAFEAAKERKEQRLRIEQEHTQKILDMLQRVREDPSKAHLLPPGDASLDDLHKWFEKMSQPQRPDFHFRNVPAPPQGSQSKQSPEPERAIHLPSERTRTDETAAPEDTIVGPREPQGFALLGFIQANKVLSALIAGIVFVLWTLPQWIATVWPVLVRDKTIPEWLAEKRWPGMTAGVYGWLTVAFFLTLVLLILIIALSSNRKSDRTGTKPTRTPEQLELIKDWRRMVSDVSRKYRSAKNPGHSFAEILERQPQYISLHPYLSDEVASALRHDKFNDSVRIVVSKNHQKKFVNPDDEIKAMLARDIARIAREWGLS